MKGKWIYLAQRNPRLSREQFLARWQKHRTLGAPPEMGAEFESADYCAVRTDGIDLHGVSDEYDAVGAFALKDIASIPLVAKFIKLDHVQADEKRFFTTTSDNFSIFCAENILRDGEETKTVLIQFLRRQATIGASAFARHWREAHSAALLGSRELEKSLTRYIQNNVIAPPPPGYGYDGIAELWFDSRDAVTAHAAELNRIWDATDFIDLRNSFSVLTDVIVSRAKRG